MIPYYSAVVDGTIIGVVNNHHYFSVTDVLITGIIC